MGDLRKTISLIELSKIVHDRSTALEFLCERFQKKNAIHCASCDDRGYHVMSRGNLRYRDCKGDYRPFAGTWLDVINIDFTKWLVLIKLFDLGISARCVARGRCQLSAALNAFDCIRHAILYHLAASDKKLRGKLRLTRRILEEKKGKLRTWCQKQDLCLEYWKGEERFTLRL